MSLEPFGDVAAYFTRWVDRFGNRGAVGEVAQWLANGEFDPRAFDAIVQTHDVSRETWFRDGLMDLVVAYARECLATGPLTDSHVDDIRVLRMALRLREEEFFQRRPAEIAAFLEDAYEAILSDGVVDLWEDLYLVEVQTAFGLSYDQLLVLLRPALERAVSDLELLLHSNVDRVKARDALQKLEALEPTRLLASKRRQANGGHR